MLAILRIYPYFSGFADERGGLGRARVIT